MRPEQSPGLRCRRRRPPAPEVVPPMVTTEYVPTIEEMTPSPVRRARSTKHMPQTDRRSRGWADGSCLSCSCSPQLAGGVAYFVTTRSNAHLRGAAPRRTRRGRGSQSDLRIRLGHGRHARSQRHGACRNRHPHAAGRSDVARGEPSRSNSSSAPALRPDRCPTWSG